MGRRLEGIQRLGAVSVVLGAAMVLAAAEARAKVATRRSVDARAVASALVDLRLDRSMRPAPKFEGFHQLPARVRDSIVAVAQALIGTRYLFGGATPEGGFDCSGLVSYVLSQVQLSLPRTARQQALIGLPVHRDDLKPGDLLTFGTVDSVSHVGIYVGGGKYVHASSVAGRVIVSPLDRPPSPQIKALAGARRLLATVAVESKGG